MRAMQEYAARGKYQGATQMVVKTKELLKKRFVTF